MIASLIIIYILITTSISHCNDECLLSKLKVNGFLRIQKKQIILPSYHISNNVYMDNALIWIHPCEYFSNKFLQQFTDKKHPTNNDFRQAFHNEYIKPNNFSLILQINTTGLNERNTEYLNNLLSKYLFDGYVYLSDNNNINNKIPQHNRVLLQHSYPNHYIEYDTMNQHTWDEYDWVLAAFAVGAFSLCVFCCGWCSHKKYMSNMVINEAYIDEYIDDEDIQTSLFLKSTKSNNKKKMAFAGFNILGEKVRSVSDQYYEHKENVQRCVTINNNNVNTIKRESKITMPTKRTSFVPKFKSNVLSPQTTGDVLVTPASCEPSQSHVSIEMLNTPNTPNTPNDNPYANIRKYNEEKIQSFGLDIITEENQNETSQKSKMSNKLGLLKKGIKSHSHKLLKLMDTDKLKVPTLKQVRSVSSVVSPPSVDQVNNQQNKLLLRPTKSQPVPKSPNLSTSE